MKTLTHPHLIANNRKLFIDRFFPGVYKLFTRPEEIGLFDADKTTRVFLVDDDPLYLKALENSIAQQHSSITINAFQTGEACLQNLKLGPSVVILDYYLNTEFPYAWNGMSILKHIKKINPKTKVIMISSQDSLAVAIDCMEKGAYDYVSKSKSAFSRINKIIRNIVGDTEVTSTFFQIVLFVVLVAILALIAGFIST